MYAVPVYTATNGVPGGGTLDELRVVHPMFMGHVAGLGGRLRLDGILNLEGLTLEDGELTPGAYGEGFVDRRHPHTYLHELVLTGEVPLAGVRTSLSAGKGFAPFGTDDPMSRAPYRYPVNHHLAQILERAVVSAAVRAGPVGLEAGLFNGDEPERPGQWPLLDRFGDSWSARVTLHPVPGVEVQGSHARVKSPEHRPGAGPVQRKWSASARLERPLGGSPVSLLAEWARTTDAGGFFVFSSLLAESAWKTGPHRLLYRFERTERPEEERTRDLFRSARPHLDNAVFTTTRWTVHTLGWGVELLDGGSRARLQPFGEFSLASVASATPDAFDPAQFYGSRRLWAVHAGVRLGWGASMHRMGRYGAARDDGSAAAGHHH